MSTDPTPYDALLLVSFGGPEAPEEVVPFLERVTAGRGIPRERLEEVGQHYFLFGGRSPINDLNRELIAAIESDFAVHGLEVPVYWGNRNSAPFLADAVRQMREDGVQRAACFLTSAYSSYSSCRQYRENLADAVAEVEGAPVLDRLRQYFGHPGFVEPIVDTTVEALQQAEDAELVFVTHSIPESMNIASGPAGEAYLRQHQDVVTEIVDRVTERLGREVDHALVFCSRSGSPHVPWLEPDVNDHLRQRAEDGATAVVVVPVGFVSDHMEVIYDLDTEAKATAEEVGLGFVRVATPGTDPRFVAMVRDLLLERAGAERGEQVDRASVGRCAVMPDLCAVGCCANTRAPDRPALGGQDA